MSEADELLADVHALRRKARADRHAYWLPLLFFGLAIAASAPLYVQHIVFSADLNQANALLLTGGAAAALGSRRDR